jgi:hypothetical protein
MEQVAPREPARDHSWFCNACRFETTSTRDAETHAELNVAPFPHFLYERERVDGRARSRLHSELGPSERVPVILRLMMPRAKARA